MAKGTQTLVSGPWRGVRTTANPFDDGSPALLASASNVYLADTEVGGGAYQRPGTVRWASVTNTGDRGQCVYAHRAMSGAIYNFLFVDGKVWRTTTTGSPVDVTPVNVSIASVRFIYCVSLNDSIIVNDGVNPPWIGTNLSGTPITATHIAYTASPGVVLSMGITNTAVGFSGIDYIAGDSSIASANNPTGTALPAGTIPLNTWGVYRVSVATGGTVTVTAGAANYTTGYASEALALAAIPNVPDNQWNVGYFTVLTAVGSPFVAGTDALQGGIGGNPSSDTNYYAGGIDPWTAFGQPVVYTGAVFFIVAQPPGGGSSRTTITWSEPNQPSVGYQQTDYDNAWTLTQTGSDPLYALAATNDALYYARAYAWGALSGAPGVNFRGTATHDFVSANIGCVAPATVRVFLNYVYFCDPTGRPWRFAIGGVPEPIWSQVQSVFDTGGQPTYVPITWWAEIEPNLNVYCVAFATTTGTYLLVFDAVTGVYFGTWDWGSFDIGGILYDADKVPQLVTVEGHSGGLSYCWKLTRVSDAIWTDNGGAMDCSVTTGALAYDAQAEKFWTQARAIVGNIAASTVPTCTLGLVTTDQTVTPFSGYALSAGADAPRYKMTWMLDRVRGRGARLTLASSLTSSQFRVWRIEADAVVSTSVIEDR